MGVSFFSWTQPDTKRELHTARRKEWMDKALRQLHPGRRDNIISRMLRLNDARASGPYVGNPEQQEEADGQQSADRENGRALSKPV